MGPRVTSEWLREHLDAADVQVVDCRYRLDDPGAGRAAYLAGHIAGAAFLDLEEDLSGPPGVRGRHPLPDPGEFGAAARRAGVRNDGRVVAYDDAMTGGAARLWWLLRHLGKDDVAVLDGGFAVWDGPVRAGEEPIPPGDFVPTPRQDDALTAEDVAAGLDRPGRVLVDARAPERYRGEIEPIDPVAGHIPGARNVPYTGAFPPPPDLVASDDELIVYCGSGVTAAVVALALVEAGRDDVRLYPGSWSEWSARGLPVATGDEQSRSGTAGSYSME